MTKNFLTLCHATIGNKEKCMHVSCTKKPQTLELNWSLTMWLSKFKYTRELCKYKEYRIKIHCMVCTVVCINCAKPACYPRIHDEKRRSSVKFHIDWRQCLSSFKFPGRFKIATVSSWLRNICFNVFQIQLIAFSLLLKCFLRIQISQLKWFSLRSKE